MKSPKDQSRRHAVKAIFRQGYHPAGNGHVIDLTSDLPSDWSAFKPWVAKERELIALETEVTEAAGQKMSLRERTVNLHLEVLLVVVFVGIEISMLIINPALFALSLSIVGTTVVALRRRGRGLNKTEEEGDP
jgi:hypothetical protein